MSQPLRMSSDIFYINNGKEDNMSNYVLKQSNGDSITFQLRLPRKGLYKYTIYAAPSTKSNVGLPGVYHYLINCHQIAGPCMEFPTQYGSWDEGCFLNYPQDGVITRASAPNSQVPVKVSVPKANFVAVVIGEELTQLHQEGPESSWEGTVPLGLHWGKESKMALCANFGSRKTSYSTLLEYSIKS